MTEARLHIKMEKEGMYRISTIDGTYIETLDRDSMMRLMLSEEARAKCLMKHNDDKFQAQR